MVVTSDGRRIHYNEAKEAYDKWKKCTHTPRGGFGDYADIVYDYSAKNSVVCVDELHKIFGW
jgi:hypothetical protein